MGRKSANFAIGFTALIYVIYLVFMRLATEGGNDLFPKSIRDVAHSFAVEIFPSEGAMSSAYVVLFILQVLWIVYAISTIFRSNGATNILSKKFYFFFSLSTIFAIVWYFLWSRSTAVGSFVVAALLLIFLDLAFYQSLHDLRDYCATHEENSCVRFDLWSQRLLVQNGILFYVFVEHIWVMLNTTIMFVYELEVSSQTASLIFLVLYALITIAWFVLENFAIQSYAQFTFTAYIATIWMHSGIHSTIWRKNEAVGVLNLILLILSCLFLIIRVINLLMKNSKKASYENIECENKQSASA